MRNWQPALLLTALLLITLAAIQYGNRPGGQEPGSVSPILPAGATSGGQNTSSAQDGAPIAPPVPVEPSTIDLASLPADLPRAENKYDLWLRGELGEGKEGLVGKEERARLEEAALRLEPSPNIQNPAIETASPGLEITASFDGPDINDCCGGGGGAVPPDPELAVGPDHVIAVINVAFEIYDKSGVSLHGPTTFAALFSGDPNLSGCTFGTTLFDPNVLYDEEADRFLLGIVGGGDYYCLAASATSDPTGAWYRYRFPTAFDGDFFDYPHAGVGRDAIYMGANIFHCNTCGYKESRIWAIDKWAMYDALTTPYRLQVLPSTDDTPQPANLHGYAHDRWPSEGPHYFVSEYLFNGATYSVWAWDDPFGANNIFKTGIFDWEAATGVSAGLPVSVRQPTGDSITANDWRPQDAEYRNGHIWTTNTIACNPGTGSVDCVRWAQIEPESAAIVQAGVVAGNDQYRFFGDLAVNHCNDMAIGYTKTDPGNSTSGYPGIWVAGRQEGDALNLLRPETPLKLSNVPYWAFDSPPRRWGDYTGFTSDPNGLDVWYIGQYSKNTGSSAALWGTFIGRFRFVPDDVSPPPPPPGLDFDIYLPYVIDTSIC